MELRDYCPRCNTTTESRTVRHISGDEVQCCVCGTQLEFYHNEEEDDYDEEEES